MIIHEQFLFSFFLQFDWYHFNTHIVKLTPYIYDKQPSKNDVHTFDMHFISDDQCQCTADYNIYSQRNGTMVRVEAYCNEWFTDEYPGTFFCYLRGGLAASTCPGAHLFGDKYITSDPSVCIEAEDAGTGSGVFCIRLL